MEKYKPEPGYREPYTEYGMEIVMFCAKHCLTKKALAAEAGIPYDSLLATIKGRRSGHNVPARASGRRQELGLSLRLAARRRLYDRGLLGGRRSGGSQGRIQLAADAAEAPWRQG